MEISDTFSVSSSAGQVWELLWDFPRLASCLPGCEEIAPVSATAYQAKMKQSIGPFSIQADMTFTVLESRPGERVAFSGVGGDRQGNRIRIDQAWVALRSISPQETEVSYSAEVVMTGKLATLGYPMVKRKTRDMGAEFSRRLAREFASPHPNPLPKGEGR